MVRLRSSLVSVWLLALLLVAASAARAQEPNWELYTVPADSGTGTSSQSGPPPVVTNHLYFLHNEAGIYESPLPGLIKEDLLPPQDPNGGISVSIEDGGEAVYIVSQEIVNGIVASENAGVLTPGIEAISEPLDEEEASSYASGVVVGNSIFGGSCATRQQTVHRVINLTDKTYTKNFPNLGNGFTGSISLNGQITGTVTTDVTLDIKRRNTLGKCVPYSVRFKNLHAFGNATSTGGITLTGTLNYSDTFGPWPIANPELFDYWTVIWYIPVRIVGTLPITAGLGVTGNVTGTINYNGNHVATGNLDYNCTLNNCTGSHTFSNSPDNLDQQITGGINGHLKADAWVDASFRVSLYSSGVANAQVGVRGHLLGDLWGFDGNNCGDADGINGNETVRALTFDLDRRIDILGKAEVFGDNVWDHTISTGAVVHVGFYDLINSTAMQPQFQGPTSLFVGDPGAFKVKIRPCWPYTDKVTYKLNWGDGGAVQELEGVPGTELTPSHTWSAAGNKTLSATSDRDAHGRALNQSTTRALEVKAITPPSVTVTPAPASSTYGNPINLTATVTGGHTPTLQYTMGRRRVGTADWIPMPLVWQAGNVLSWTPGAADVGSWELAIAVKDRTTAPDANGLGYAAAAVAGTVNVVAPLILSCPPVVQRTVTSGTTFTWSGISSTGGTPGTIEYAYSRQLTGNANNPWLPNPMVWQTNTAFSWTPAASDVGTWQFYAITRDANSPANLGYTSTCNMGQVVVVSPLTVTVTPSPASSIHGNAITWTATANGGIPASTQFAFFRRRAGDTVWIPPVPQPIWQTTPYTWTPGAADVGPWEIVVWVKDGNTPANANTLGYASYANAGLVQVVTPPLTLSVTASPTNIVYGNTISWQATATGGTPSTTRFALFRRKAGTVPWTPDAATPNWQTGPTLTWTPTSADVGTWEIYVWVKDGDTPSNMNTYGYAVGRGAGNVDVVEPPPLTLTVTPSPASVVYGNPVSWTATAGGGNSPSTFMYAFFRRRSGTIPWTPDVTIPNWQASRTFTWQPGAADVGTWDIYVWVKDANTPSTQNTYGYGAGANAGPVKVVTPALTLTATASPATTYHGITLNWTATAGGGTPATIQYALFRRPAGTTTWTPAVTAPAWQTSPNLSWTSSPADVGTWEISIWVKDGDTPSTQNTYGYATSYNPGTAQIVAPPTLSVTGSPASVSYGTPITWTASSTSSNPASVRYAFFRRRSGTTPWTPAATSPNWQAGNTFTWTPTSADAGTWDTYVWVKDAYTPASMNTYGYAAGFNTGGVRVVAPLSGLTCSGNLSGGYTGTSFNWSANPSGGDPATLQYALFRRRVGSSTWVPAQSSPSWQTSNSFNWSTLSSDAGSYDIVIWAKDGNTPANANTYGYAVSCSPGTIQVVTPPTVTGTTSPSMSPYGATISWTATASGGDAGSMRYAIFRRRAGTSAWTPDVTNPSWQSGRTFSWTPTSADVGTWEVFIWVKDAYTPSNMNTYGHAAWYNAGNVDVTTPAPVTVSGTVSPSTSPAGTTISWTATASGGIPSTYQYAIFRRRAGTTPWTPDVTSPNWQSSRTMSWTPSAADVGTWEIFIWVKDTNTSPTQNTYGFASYYNAQPVQVY